MAYQELKFGYNWNGKLNNNAFTTIRLKNDKKYYKGARFTVVLTGKKDEVKTVGDFVVIDIKEFLITELNRFMSFLDTGYDVKETQKVIYTMYKNKNIDWKKQRFQYILLARIK